MCGTSTLRSPPCLVLEHAHLSAAPSVARETARARAHVIFLCSDYSVVELFPEFSL